jgi:heptaprenyl diphosphate synthase
VIGEEMALLAGLACFALAGTEAADLGGGVDRMVSRTAAGLAYGEMLDVERAFDTSLGLPEYLELVERKTGDLFRLTCALGATEARLRATQARALSQFGTALGVAFQVLDDCLDLVADAGDKPVGTDHLLGLFGAPTLCALQGDAGEELSAVLLSPSLDVGDLPKVRALVVDGGGLAAARRLAQEWYDWALAALDPLPRGAAHTLLTATAERVWTGGR